MKYIKSGIYLLISMLVFSSCEKELDQNDPQSFSDANAFQTIEHVQYGVNGAFGRYSAYLTDIYKSALVSDEVKIGPDNSGSGLLTYRYQYSSDNTTGADVIAGYYDYYSLIDQVNRVLPHVYTVTGGTAARKDELTAHLLGLRALAHFGLLQSFSKTYAPAEKGIAIMTESNPAAKPARNTMGEVMTQIEADLTKAKTLLPAVTAATFSDTIINRINIAAYQARIALFKRDYDAAITYSTEVISSGIKPLVSGSAFAGIWTDANTNETLFRIRLLQSPALGSLWTTTGGAISLSPSDKLVSSYGAGDSRLSIFIGTSGSNSKFVNKHYVSSRGGRIVDIKACRIAEMYLIRAEAYAKRAAPDLTAGGNDLNLLRSRRIASYTNETFTTAANLVKAVLDERFKELCFEGFRIYDLKRNNLPVERLASDASPGWQTLAATSYLFVFPVPRSATLANPNTIQNDGY